MGVAWIGIAAVALDAVGTVVGYLLWGWPALVVGLPVLLGGVVVAIVLVLTSTQRRMLRDLAEAGAGVAVPMPGRGRPGDHGGSTSDAATWYHDSAPPGSSGEFVHHRHHPGGRHPDHGPAPDTSCDPTSSGWSSGSWSDATSSSSDGSSSSSSSSSSESSSSGSSGSDSSSSSSW